MWGSVQCFSMHNEFLMLGVKAERIDNEKTESCNN